MENRRGNRRGVQLDSTIKSCCPSFPSYPVLLAILLCSRLLYSLARFRHVLKFCCRRGHSPPTFSYQSVQIWFVIWPCLFSSSLPRTLLWNNNTTNMWPYVYVWVYVWVYVCVCDCESASMCVVAVSLPGSRRAPKSSPDEDRLIRMVIQRGSGPPTLAWNRLLRPTYQVLRWCCLVGWEAAARSLFTVELRESGAVTWSC